MSAADADGASPNGAPPRSNVVALREGFGDWRDRLVTQEGKRGRVVVSCTANAITILRNDPAWAGVLAWNELAQGIVARRPPPWDLDDAPADAPTPDRSGAWRDSDGVRVQSWLQRRYMIKLSPKECYAAALIVAESARFDPIVDWFSGLVWDGVQRVDWWASTYLGAHNTAYARLVGRLFLLSVVARGLAPGCKVDTMLVLEGDQGINKSTAIERLIGADFFSDTPLDMGTKDRFLALRGILCHEVAELDSFGKSDISRVKSFLSSRTDDFRPPYAASNVRVPRRCVFVGTVNPSALGYLRDETGNRRIWPLRCGEAGPIRLDLIERDREQIFAEAIALHRVGHRWWPQTREEQALCNAEVEERVSTDVWLGKIAKWLESKMPGARVTIPECLTYCLNIEVGDQGQQHNTRVGMCFAMSGWVVAGRRGGGDRERYYGRRAEVEAERRERAAADAVVHPGG